MAVSIQFGSVVRMIRNTSLDRVQALSDVMEARLFDKADEGGLELGRDKAKSPYTGEMPDGSDNVNMAGVNRWIGSVTAEKSPKDSGGVTKGMNDLHKLLVLYATAQQRING